MRCESKGLRTDVDPFSGASGSPLSWDALSQSGSHVDALLDRMAASQAQDMNTRVHQRFIAVADPVARMAMGIRFYVKRAGDEPQWGRLVTSFGFRGAAQRSISQGFVSYDLSEGISAGRFLVRQEHMGDALSLVSGAVIGAVARVVNDGADATEAGTHAAAFVLKAFGVPAERAEHIASLPLPE